GLFYRHHEQARFATTGHAQHVPMGGQVSRRQVVVARGAAAGRHGAAQKEFPWWQVGDMTLLGERDVQGQARDVVERKARVACLASGALASGAGLELLHVTFDEGRVATPLAAWAAPRMKRWQDLFRAFLASQIECCAAR